MLSLLNRKKKEGIVQHWFESMKGVSNFIKIQCPRNYVLKPGCNPYKVKLNPWFKNITQANVDFINKSLKVGIKRYTIERDAAGNKIKDPNSYYKPFISPAYALEHIYDPENPICARICRNECVRKVGGYGNIGLIKRIQKEN